MKEKKHIIYSNYNLEDCYTDAKQYLIEENGEEPSEEDIWEEINFQDSLEWDEVYYSLTKFFKGKQLIMTGTVGRWTGACAGGKIGKFEDLFSAIMKDCDYAEFKDVNGHFYLTCTHHDGTNYVEFKELTDRGCQYSENWNYSYSSPYNCSEQEMHNKIMNCSFLSRLPRYWEKVWGD